MNGRFSNKGLLPLYVLTALAVAIDSQTTFAKPAQSVQPVQLVTPPQDHIENPTTWMRNGNSQAEIILAVAVLISSLSGLLQVLLPLILRQPHKKTQ